jgi:putative hydrolase of the HAD superfamily
LKYVIWDFDGTLAYRNGKWSGTLIEVLHREIPDHPATLADIRPYMQTGFPWDSPELPHTPATPPDQWWEALLPLFENAFRQGAQLDAGDARRLAKRVRETYIRPDAWRLFDDSIPCLLELRSRGWQHVVLSNHVPELRGLIRVLELDPYIEQVFNSAETGFEKPHPAAFRTVVEAIQEAEQIWMVGDSISADIGGATAAGLPSVLVRNRHPEVARCCETLAGLPGILNSD